MSMMQPTSEPTAAQANKNGCGCGGHSDRVQAEESPARAQEQPGPSTHNKDIQIKHATDHSGCCCGDKAAS
jgi:hypothetical protein